MYILILKEPVYKNNLFMNQTTLLALFVIAYKGTLAWALKDTIN